MANKRWARGHVGAKQDSTPMRHPNDMYSTPPQAVEMLLELEDFGHEIYEPCAGLGVVTNVLEEHGKKVESCDIEPMFDGCIQEDFFSDEEDNTIDMNIITNPPYKRTVEFIDVALSRLKTGRKMALFLPISFLEGIKHSKLIEKYPIKRVYVSRRRLNCPRWNETKTTGGVVCYIWAIWEKGWNGETVLRWFN